MNVDASLETVTCQGGLCCAAGHTISLVLFFPEINSISARVLLSLVVPGHLIFFHIIYLVEGHLVPNSKIFVVFYLLASLIQVSMTLAVSKQHSVVRQPVRFVSLSWERCWEVKLQGEVPGHGRVQPHLPRVHLFKPKGMIQTERPFHTLYCTLHTAHSP